MQESFDRLRKNVEHMNSGQCCHLVTAANPDRLRVAKHVADQRGSRP